MKTAPLSVIIFSQGLIIRSFELILKLSHTYELVHKPPGGNWAICVFQWVELPRSRSRSVQLQDSPLGFHIRQAIFNGASLEHMDSNIGAKG